MKDYLQKATHSEEEYLAISKNIEKRKMLGIIKKFEMNYPPDVHGLYPISISHKYDWTPEEVLVYTEAKHKYAKYLDESLKNMEKEKNE
jgi:hypothetical protein